MALIMLATKSVHAQNGGNIVVPCAVPFYRELDFIVGDWQVFHNSTGKLAGYDRIGRTLRGCAIQQSWISLDDHFSSEYVPFRMYGKSLTAFNGSEWVHMWVDNKAAPKRTVLYCEVMSRLVGLNINLLGKKAKMARSSTYINVERSILMKIRNGKRFTNGFILRI